MHRYVDRRLASWRILLLALVALLVAFGGGREHS